MEKREQQTAENDPMSQEKGNIEEWRLDYNKTQAAFVA